jgi:hypothetical protein
MDYEFIYPTAFLTKHTVQQLRMSEDNSRRQIGSVIQRRAGKKYWYIVCTILFSSFKSADVTKSNR